MHTATLGIKTAPGLVRRLAGRSLSFALPLAIGVLQGCASAPSAPAKPVESAAKPGQAAAAPANQAPAVPPQVQAEFDAAMALVKAEQYEQSVEAWKKLAAATPTSPVPLINLALVYKKLQKLDLAEAQLKAALQLESDNPVAANELALIYRKTGRFADARPLYEGLLTKYPNFQMAHKNLGVLCDLYLRDYECALIHYRAYATGAPDDKNVKIWIADLEKRAGK